MLLHALYDWLVVYGTLNRLLCCGALEIIVTLLLLLLLLKGKNSIKFCVQCIRGTCDDALYKLIFYLLTYLCCVGSESLQECAGGQCVTVVIVFVTVAHITTSRRQRSNICASYLARAARSTQQPRTAWEHSVYLFTLLLFSILLMA